MKCKSCGYSLWNITARVCPECAAPFKPSDYEFKPNAVRFCCPSCDQSYYGTDEHGMLVPRSFVCVSCQCPVTMDAMVVRPVEGMEDSEIELGTVPWMADKSKVSGFFRTVGYSMTAPSRIAQALQTSTGQRGAVTFALAVNFIGIVVAFGLQVVLMSVWGAFIGASGAGGVARGGPPVGALMGFMAMGSVFVVAIWFLLMYAWLYVWSGLSHLFLNICGCTKYPFSKTLGVVGYSCGPLVLAWVPCIGQYLAVIGSVWRVISAAIMTAKLHPKKPTVAVLCITAPPLLAFAAVILAVVLLLQGAVRAMSAASAGGSAPPWAAPAPSSNKMAEAWVVANALDRYRAEKRAWPEHAVLLADGMYLLPGDLMLNSHMDLDTNVVLSGRALLNMSMMTAEELATLAGIEHAKAVAAGDGGYRLGDYIFCYDGVDPDVNPERWVFIQSDRTSRMAPPKIEVGLASKMVIEFTEAEWGPMLDAENEARRLQGLAPISDPFAPVPPTEGVPTDGPPADGAPADGAGGG